MLHGLRRERQSNVQTAGTWLSATLAAPIFTAGVDMTFATTVEKTIQLETTIINAIQTGHE